MRVLLTIQTLNQTFTATAVADSTGRAEAAIGQVPIGVTWRNISTQILSDSTLLSRAQVYKGISDTAANQLDDTGPLGGNSNSSASAWVIYHGEPLRVVWTGATPGAQCSATIQVIQAGI